MNSKETSINVDNKVLVIGKMKHGRKHGKFIAPTL